MNPCNEPCNLPSAGGLIATGLESGWRELLESTPDAIVMVDAHGRMVFVNGQAEALFGYRNGGLFGQSVDLLLPERFRSAHVFHRRGFTAAPRARSMGEGRELFGRRADGSEFPVEISLSSLQTAQGMVVMSAIRDVTDRKLVQAELERKNRQLANANLAKDRFLASMSHELRTPLNAIIGFTGTLLMRMPGPLNEQQVRQMQTVQSSAQHLLSLINELLDLARIGADKPDIASEWVDCGAVIEDVVMTLQVLAKAKGISLSTALPVHALRIRTDGRALKQVLINLVHNAIKFTDRGGVRVTAGIVHRGDSGGLRIEVEDSGIGIREEDLGKLFTAFSRLAVAEHPHVEGTGLGLHLSQKLAHAIGGVIDVRSIWGVGSTFSLELVGGP